MPPDAGGRGRKSSCLPEEPLILSRCERTAAIHCLGGSHRNRTPFLRNYQDHTGVIQYHLRKWTQLSLMLQMRKYIFVHTCCRSPHGERGLKLPLPKGLRAAWGRSHTGGAGEAASGGRNKKKKDTTEGLSPIGTQCGPMGLNAVYGERAILWSICRKIALNLLGCLFEGTHNYFRATGVDEHSTP